jgi:hypothetical protein
MSIAQRLIYMTGKSLHFKSTGTAVWEINDDEINSDVSDGSSEA